MFPMVRLRDRNKNYAAFVLENDPDKVQKNRASLFTQNRLIVRTRADSFGSINAKTRQTALQCGAQMLSTDYPPIEENHGLPTFSLPGGYTLKQTS